MSKPSPRAVRALAGVVTRRLLRALALAALVLPLTALASAGASVDVSPQVDLDRALRTIDTPHGLVTIEDATLAQGSVEVVSEGRPGLAVATELVLRVDGEIESRLTVQRATILPAIDRVVRVGIGDRPERNVWDDLALCESDGRWDAVRDVDGQLAYHGGLQFHPQTWRAFRPAGFPDLASGATREQQIVVARRVLERQGWGAWPSCAKRLGLR